jgi:hypothetical protein
MTAEATAEMEKTTPLLMRMSHAGFHLFHAAFL